MRRGEIWLINLDPTVGAEIKKTRPAVIVNSNNLGILPLKVIAPITDWKDKYSQARWMVRIEPSKENGLRKPSAIDTFQIRSLSQERFVKIIGKVNLITLERINEALTLVLDIRKGS